MFAPHQIRPSAETWKAAPLNQTFTALRTAGASIINCIVSIRSLHRCTIEGAKRLVESSPVYSDHWKSIKIPITIALPQTTIGART
jgi:ribosomal protein L7/L12